MVKAYTLSQLTSHDYFQKSYRNQVTLSAVLDKAWSKHAALEGKTAESPTSILDDIHSYLSLSPNTELAQKIKEAYTELDKICDRRMEIEAEMEKMFICKSTMLES